VGHQSTSLSLFLLLLEKCKASLTKEELLSKKTKQNKTLSHLTTTSERREVMSWIKINK
jgi:hypothetical protein